MSMPFGPFNAGGAGMGRPMAMSRGLPSPLMPMGRGVGPGGPMQLPGMGVVRPPVTGPGMGTLGAAPFGNGLNMDLIRRLAMMRGFGGGMGLGQGQPQLPGARPMPNLGVPPMLPGMGPYNGGFGR